MSTVITISRQLGSNGSIIATEVARRLSLRYLDREILHRAAEIAGFPDQAMLDNLEIREHRLNILQKMRDSLLSITIPPEVPSATMREHAAFGLNYVPFEAMDDRAAKERYDAITTLHEHKLRAQAAKGYRALVEQVVKEQAQKGNAVIVGRGAQVILRDMPGVLSVLIIAPEAVRIRRLVEYMGIEEKEAKQRVQNSDREREAYLRYFKKTSWQDLSLYDLTINTGKISIDFAVNIICDALPNLGT